jgi:hypothetical protein
MEEIGREDLLAETLPFGFLLLLDLQKKFSRLVTLAHSKESK